MNWNIWKQGLFVALLSGLLTGLAAFQIADRINWQAFLIFLAGCVAKDGLFWIKSHPVPEQTAQLQLPIEKV